MTVKTAMQPVDSLVIGVQFIPKGKKRPVTIIQLSQFHGPTIDVYAESRNGLSAHVLSRYEDVEVVCREQS